MNFLSQYLKYSECNESPREYHQWAGLSILSNIIGPRVWTHMGGHLSWYPNLYVFLVGKPGSMKTTSMRQAEELLRNFPHITFAPTSASKEAIVELMKGDDSPCHGTYEYGGKKVPFKQLAVFASEFVSLLNASGNAPGMIEFLTEVWDRTGKIYDEVFKKSKTYLKNPYFSACCCLTPSTLQDLVKSKVVTNGMSRRCIFVIQNGINKPRYRIIVTPDQQVAWDWCVEHCRKLLQLSGPFSWTDEADAFHEAWYNKFKPTVVNEQSEALQNFFMTKQEYVVKLSMLLALAQPEPKLVHTLETFQHALNLVTSVEKGASNLFDNTGRNELTSVAGALEDFLRERSGKKLRVREDIYTRFWNQVKMVTEIDAILDHFSRQGKIKTDVEIEQIQGQSVTVKYVTYLI